MNKILKNCKGFTRGNDSVIGIQELMNPLDNGSITESHHEHKVTRIIEDLTLKCMLSLKTKTNINPTLKMLFSKALYHQVFTPNPTFPLYT
ncbi:hypothetical protein CDL12_06238 [Handroanthus impetiginosus]|uniref:Uncharacterized protein n=1 Tax=Handroanthus impetiginosus TaxID=429701 RepID=A0A2G9HUR9_9LAMI|nr:hypothetical protein CDL12_06238 [Handroanthus impetiginosus]